MGNKKATAAPEATKATGTTITAGEFGALVLTRTAGNTEQESGAGDNGLNQTNLAPNEAKEFTDEIVRVVGLHAQGTGEDMRALMKTYADEIVRVVGLHKHSSPEQQSYPQESGGQE